MKEIRRIQPAEWKWLEFPSDVESPIIRQKITLHQVHKAKITICGLGFFELFVNGTRVSDDWFKPVWTDYRKRDLSNAELLYPINDEFTHRINFVEYDISGFVRDGKNIISLMLGNGWFRQREKNVEGKFSYGDKLLLCYRIEAEGEKTAYFYSDESLKFSRGYILQNNLYYGETHDYNLYETEWMHPDYDDSNWQSAALAETPQAIFELQQCPNDRITRTVTPKLLSKQNGAQIFDAGESLSGWVRCRSAAKQNIEIRYAEHINEDLTLNYGPDMVYDHNHGKGTFSSDRYLNAEQGRDCRPFFVWHGFRYFEIHGEASGIICEVVTSDIARASEFESDNETLNWFYEACTKTFLANMHCGVTSDCPHRERLGYTGDGQLIADASLLLLDGKEFFRKWMQDIADCQDIKTGHVQHTAPFYGGGGGPGGWGIAIVNVPYMYYRHTGDINTLKAYFPNMKRYINSMESFTEDGLIVKEREGGWCLGEWCTPDKTELPEAFVNTCFYIKAMQRVEEISAAIGEKTNYAKQKEAAASALDKKYFDASAGTYCGGIQGANLFALDIGLGNSIMAQKEIEKYEKAGVFDTGMFGTELLIDLLDRHKRPDLIVKLLTADEYPSFGYMKKSGSWTIWETWNGHASHCHPMFGSAVKYLFYSLLGIKPLEAGWKVVQIEAPGNLGPVKRISGTLQTAAGPISVKYVYSGSGVKVEINAAPGIDVRRVNP